MKPDPSSGDVPVGAKATGPTDPWLNRVLCGDATEVIPQIPAGSADCAITSPPYFRQRDYGDPRQIGQEETAELYLQRLLAVFNGLRRVIHPQGSLWVVMGDKYVDGRLLGLPWRLALAVQDQGWILRSDCIWHKPNAMPSAVRSRPTTDHEYLFLFSHGREYYYDADAVRQPHVTFSPESRMRGGRKHFGRRGGTPEKGKNGGSGNLHDGRWDQAFHPLGRNCRTVWSIPLSKCREAHFAVFPESLVEICLKASCPPGGLVLDPFLGSGTTARVARRMGRNYLGIDCSREYCALARQRIAEVESAVDEAAEPAGHAPADSKADAADGLTAESAAPAAAAADQPGQEGR